MQTTGDMETHVLYFRVSLEKMAIEATQVMKADL